MKRRWSFALRTLLALTFVCAAAMGFAMLLYRVHVGMRQADAILFGR